MQLCKYAGKCNIICIIIIFFDYLVLLYHIQHSIQYYHMIYICMYACIYMYIYTKYMYVYATVKRMA